jgi:L-galactose dehydrogenase/L-glyceraldehyde 3-phosphate reductase
MVSKRPLALNKPLNAEPVLGALRKEEVMQKRQFGRTGLQVSILTFGCGAVGGLMTKGDPKDQERAVARALELGINHFDTAPQYGNGASEENLGRILGDLKPDVIVSTKVRIPPAERGRIGAFIAASMETSLKRLRRERVDLYQLHNPLALAVEGEKLTADEVLGEVVPALQRLRQQGKTRFLGFTAIGDTSMLHKLIDSGAFDAAQVPYNALNPSAGAALPARYPAQDYGRLLDRAKAKGVGTIGIRVLAGGALSGREERHPLGMPMVEPIGSGSTYKADVERARRLEPMLREGHAGSLTELAMRFAIAHPALSTTEIGLATIAELEAAAAAIDKGPLSPQALARLAELQSAFAGEPR